MVKAIIMIGVVVASLSVAIASRGASRVPESNYSNHMQILEWTFPRHHRHNHNQ